MVFETTTGRLLHQVDVDDETFREITFSPDGKLLAAGGTWTVRVWDMETGKAAWQFEGHRGRVTSLAFSPDGKRLASASDDSTVLVWDVSR
jgi:WD40 repeat protein